MVISSRVGDWLHINDRHVKQDSGRSVNDDWKTPWHFYLLLEVSSSYTASAYPRHSLKKNGKFPDAAHPAEGHLARFNECKCDRDGWVSNKRKTVDGRQLLLMGKAMFERLDADVIFARVGMSFACHDPNGTAAQMKNALREKLQSSTSKPSPTTGTN